MLPAGINNSVVRGTPMPNYSNATKEQSAMIFIPNRYTRIYYSVIERAQSRILPKDSYREKHHIVPRCMGGTDDPTNIVELTFKEHVFCHKLLVRMTEGPIRGRLAFASVLMAGKAGNKICNSDRKLLAEEMSRLNTGKTPITNGVVDKVIFKGQTMPAGFYKGFSPATIKKHGDGNKGKRWITNGVESYQPKDSILPEGFYYGQAEYQKEKNSRPGRLNPMYGLFFITNGKENSVCDFIENIPTGWYKGKIEKKSEKKYKAKEGKNNPNFGKATVNAIQIEIDGVTYRSVSEARSKTGLSRGNIEKLYKGK
jgi:hypothetical protein